VINPLAKFEVCIFSLSRDISGCQNLKVGHLTQATLPYDLFLYFLIVLRGSQLIFKFHLDWTYCFGDIAIVNYGILAGKCLFGPIFSSFGGF